MPTDNNSSDSLENIPLCAPELTGLEQSYVQECLDTGWVSSAGSYVERFETDVSRYVRTRFAIATSSGTSALHIALLVAGVEPEDEVLVSTLSFIAPANAIRYTGAWPVFIDAESEYWQMDPQKVVDFLAHECRWTGNELQNTHTGRRVRAIMPVHILGHPCDMKPLMNIAKKYNLVVIGDATESLGAKYQESKVGQIEDIACFSFNGNKVITAGGGGMIVTDDESMAHQAKYLTTQAKDDEIEYIHHHVGYNYRLSNVHAAIGCAQMEHLDQYIAAKRQITRTYSDALSEVPGLTLIKEAPWAHSTAWMYTLLVDPRQYGIDSRALLSKLGKSNIQTRPLWQPLHQSLAHKKPPPFDCPVADYLNEHALSLPSSVGLTSEQQERVISQIRHNAVK